MDGHQEIAKNGFMKGKYAKGAGVASGCCGQHTPVFNCKMCGTFNIQLRYGRINQFKPTLTNSKNQYFLVKIIHKSKAYYGWAVRGHESRQPYPILEICTKKLLPESLKKEPFGVVILERWSEDQVKEWSEKQYWFQGFPFAAVQKADSLAVWNTINRQVDWSGQTVLDIGCHTGYFAFKASQAGARVVGFEPDLKTLKRMRTIQEHIIMSDVKLVKEDPGKTFDTILYLSVHHQPDPTYENLEDKIKELVSRTRKHLFVELIIPPLYPKRLDMTEKDLNRIVLNPAGSTYQQTLLTYRHKVRGTRRIYRIDK